MSNIEVTEDDGYPDGTVQQTSTVDRQRSRWPFLIALLGVVAGAGFLAYSVISRDNSLTPAEAATEMVDSMTAGDLLGMVAIMPPSERAAIAGPALSIIDELQRLGIVADSIDAEDPLGDLAFTMNEPVFTVVEESEDLVIVAVDHQGGTGPADLANTILQPFIDQIEDADLADDEPWTFEPGRLHVATVEEDGDWYVSPLHTFMEYGRTVEDTPFPAGPFVTAAGAATGDAVLQDMVTALTDGEFMRAIELLDPDEFQGLQRYAPSVFDLDEIGEEFRSALDDEDVTIDATIDSAVGEDDRGTYVTVDGFTIDVEVSEEFSLSYGIVDGCLELKVDGPEEISQIFPSDTTLCEDDLELDDRADLDDLSIPDGLLPPIVDVYLEEGAVSFGGIRVNEIDGTWYLSPWQTSWAWVEDLLRPLDADVISATIDWAEELADDPERFESLFQEFFEGNEELFANPLTGFAFGAPGAFGDPFSAGEEQWAEAEEDPWYEESDGPNGAIYVSPDLLPDATYRWQYSPEETVDFGLAPRELADQVFGSVETEVSPPAGVELFVYYVATEYTSVEAAIEAMEFERNPGSWMEVTDLDQPVGAILATDNESFTSAVFQSGNVVYRASVFSEASNAAEGIEQVREQIVVLAAYVGVG